MPEHQQTQQSKKPALFYQKQKNPENQIHANPAAIIQRARINPKSLTQTDVLQLQRSIGNKAVGKLLSGTSKLPSTVQQPPVQRQEIPEEEEPLQGKMIEPLQLQEIMEEETLQGKMAETIQLQEIPEEEEPLQGKMAETIQRQEIPEGEEPLQGRFESKPDGETCPSCSTPPVQREEGNRTGMPDNLKSGLEQLSGMDLSDVRVHRNSGKPEKVGALAYTQGTEIHVAPGQEKHLPHEGWHVVQQMQGRVKPTIQAMGVAINNDTALEHEADRMGGQAQQIGTSSQVRQLHSLNAVCKKTAGEQDKEHSNLLAAPTMTKTAVQCVVLQAKGWTWNGTSWVPDSGSNMPQPSIRGSAIGARLVTPDVETVDDVVADCPNIPLSIEDYNRGRNYAVTNFGFKGHPAHGSNSVHKNPRARLREMADAGATVEQLHEVRRLWGI